MDMLTVCNNIKDVLAYTVFVGVGVVLPIGAIIEYERSEAIMRRKDRVLKLENYFANEKSRMEQYLIEKGESKDIANIVVDEMCAEEFL